MAINQYTPTFIRVLGFGTSHRAAIAVSLGLSVVAGFVMHRLIELPAIRLRDYLLPSVRVRERNPGPVEAIRGEATGEICSMASTITLKNA
jgi:peptidoglycan/LPS O-acetylase OafA/YrhL